MIGKVRVQPVPMKPALRPGTGEIKMEMPIYPTVTPTEFGNDVRLEEETRANGGHYILIIAAIIAGVYLINKKLEDKGL